MYRPFPITSFRRFLFIVLPWFISLAIHVLIIVAVVIWVRPGTPLPVPSTTPVEIVHLPPEEARILPSERVSPPRMPQAPSSVRRVSPQQGSPRAVPGGRGPSASRDFGNAPKVKLPSMHPETGMPSEKKSGEGGAAGTTVPKGKGGPLPFLSQNDIDELARKGMPEKGPDDNSVTLDTDEFKFLSYNRWLKIRVESILRYPELAAQSGIQGTLYIKFDIMKDGSLANLELLKSSGYKILDDEALRAIRDSAPFQPLPSEWNMDRYSIRAAVLFYLSEAYIR